MCLNQVLYEEFSRWCKHHNKELSYAGYAAIEAFLKEVQYDINYLLIIKLLFFLLLTYYFLAILEDAVGNILGH